MRPKEFDLNLLKVLDALIGLARTYRRQGTHTKAAAIYEKFLKQFPDDAALTEQLYLLTLARRPTPAEREAVTRQQSAADVREAFFADLFWALLNTKEFAFNH